MPSPATTELLWDIRNLAKDTFSIARTFQDVKEKISEVIGLVQHIPVIPIADHIRAKKLAEEWSKHGETYTTLVWDSRRVAGNAEAAVKDFTRGILPFVQSDDTNFEDKCIELRNCAEQLEGDERSAAETSQRFSDLKEGVKNTSNAWRSLSRSFRVALGKKGLELGVKILKLDGALMFFNEKIESQTKRVSELSSSSGGSILQFLSPFYWFRRVRKWIHKLQAEKARATSIAERDDIDQQLKAAVKERDAYEQKYQQLSRDLLEIDSGFDSIIEKLIVFGRVWAALRADIQSIQFELSKAGSSKTSRLMGIRLRSAEELYGHLAEALREYQLCVNEEDLRP